MVFSFSCHLPTACTASFDPITLSDGMNCAQSSDEELGFALSWLEWRRKQMIQLIINRSLSKSKPFWQTMTKKQKQQPPNCLRVFAISSLPILNNCSLAACLQYNPQGVWIDCSNIFTLDSFFFFVLNMKLGFSLYEWRTTRLSAFNSPAHHPGSNEHWLWLSQGGREADSISLSRCPCCPLYPCLW